MAFLATAVAIFGTGLLLNLALTFALIRRMRHYGEHLAKRGMSQPAPILPVGAKVPEFAIQDISGETRSLTGARSVLAFLAPRCAFCKAQLPEFKKYAESIAGGAAQVLVVIAAAEQDAAPYLVRELDGVASIAFEHRQGPVHTALSATRFPTFYVIDASGRIEGAGPTVRDLKLAELV